MFLASPYLTSGKAKAQVSREEYEHEFELF